MSNPFACSPRSPIVQFMDCLPTCINRDLMDAAALEFSINFNTKDNRQKLVNTLYNVNR